jgi:hypothetical protein
MEIEGKVNRSWEVELRKKKKSWEVELNTKKWERERNLRHI